MLSIAEALNYKARTEPYDSALIGTVAKRVENTLVLGNNVGDVAKVVASRMKENENKKLKEGNTVVIRTFKKGNYECLLLNEKTKVTITQKETLPRNVIEKAEEMLCPKTPPRKNIGDIKTPGGLTSIQGKVVMVRI